MKNKLSNMPSQKKTVSDILGPHCNGSDFAGSLSASDTHTNSDVPHRLLALPSDRGQLIAEIKKSLIIHHASKEKVERLKKQLEALNIDVSEFSTIPIPRTDKTRKGNLAEIFLAEYINSASGAQTPIYRLRYNPNVEQSMKGDDVIAIDFSTDPPKIFIGEAKFRKNSSKKTVTDIVDSLNRSYACVLPISLQFAADRLFEQGENTLGQKIIDYIIQITKRKIDIGYVGFLMSNVSGVTHIKEYTEEHPNHKMVMISLADNDIIKLYEDCYANIEDELIDYSI